MAGLAVLIAGIPVDAHDFWLASSPWRPSAPLVTITGNVGERFPTPETFPPPDRIERLWLVGPRGEIAVEPAYRREQNSLAADLQLPHASGTYLVVMTVKPRVAPSTPKEWMSYLQAEGLDGIVAEWQKSGETARDAREKYSRYAKAVIRHGSGASAHVTRPLGLRAEFVPETDPSGLRAGQTLTVRLLADGQPVKGALVGAVYEAWRGAVDDWPLKARTDADGRVRLTLDHAGSWLVRTVHMERARNASASEADWESYWATLTFQIGDRSER
jgi:uncharacterized GH25 family protein